LLKNDLKAGEFLFCCCRPIWLNSHQVFCDLACKVALSRVFRPVIPFNFPIACFVQRLSRFVAELVLRDWSLSPLLGQVSITVSLPGPTQRQFILLANSYARGSIIYDNVLTRLLWFQIIRIIAIPNSCYICTLVRTFQTDVMNPLCNC
jgi:hypothetical protein